MATNHLLDTDHSEQKTCPTTAHPTLVQVSFKHIFTNLTSFMGKVKVKCTLAQTLRLCTGRTAHRGSRGIALLFLDHGTRRGLGVSVTPQPLFNPGKDP